MRALLTATTLICLLTATADRSVLRAELPALPKSPPTEAAPVPLVSAERQRIVTGLVEALGDPDLEVRQNVGFALAAFGRDAVPALRTALRDPSPLRRSGAAYALGILGRAGGEALPDVVAALKDEDRDVRRQAALAASRLATATGGVTPTTMPAPPPPEPVPFTGAPK